VRRTGKITFWKRNKGYGFITPNSGAKQVFVHINEFINRDAQPKIGQLVSFSLSKDKQGRPCAIRVARADEKVPGENKRYSGLLIILAAALFLVVVALLVLVGKIPVQILLVYLAASALTFIVYAMDKSAAQRDAWRTSESTLHVLSLVGGWPGALLAQQTLRHKSSKEAFRFVFWLTVIVNVGVFVWLLTASGSAFLHSLLA
jgi:uncharacterized membrane protein YsdA (DUF1294 family)/cold shock CspA family protein